MRMYVHLGTMTSQQDLFKSEPQAKVWRRRVTRPQPRRGAEFPQSRVSRRRSRSRPILFLYLS